MSSPYFRPQFSQGWLEPRAPHVSPGEGAANLALVRLLERLDFAPDEEHAQHHVAVARLREIFEQVLVPLSYLDEQDALGLCVVNCNLQTLLEQNDELNCIVYLMRRNKVRLRRLDDGVIPELFQGRSSKGASSYPGDRAFCHATLPTIQVHMLRVEDGSRTIEPVPAIAVRLPSPRDVLIHED